MLTSLQTGQELRVPPPSLQAAARCAAHAESIALSTLSMALRNELGAVGVEGGGIGGLANRPRPRSRPRPRIEFETRSTEPGDASWLYRCWVFEDEDDWARGCVMVMPLFGFRGRGRERGRGRLGSGMRDVEAASDSQNMR